MIFWKKIGIFFLKFVEKCQMSNASHGYFIWCILTELFPFFLYSVTSGPRFSFRYFIFCFRVNASKQFTQGLGDQVCVLGLFGGESRIVGREGGFKASAEKLAKFIG